VVNFRLTRAGRVALLLPRLDLGDANVALTDSADTESLRHGLSLAKLNENSALSAECRQAA
jgi:hypothetical protein